MKQFNLLFAFAIIFVSACHSEKPPASIPSPSPAPSAPAQFTAPPPEPTNLPKEILLFDGKSLSGWKVTDFGGHGEIEIKDSAIQCNMGADLSGVTWTNAAVLPRTNYEVELDAIKLDGSDFFCAFTFPVSNSFCSLIVGGWGGGIVGLSSLDGMDASENDTSKNRYFERNRWFHIRVRVMPDKIMAWIDDDKIIDVETTGRKVSVRAGGIEMCQPLGLSTWQTSAMWKNIKLRRL